MERLTAEDQLMLWPDEIWPQDIGALAVLDGSGLLDPDGRFRIEQVRQAIGSRLPLVPRFRQVLLEPRRGLGRPLWVDDPSFDLTEHVGVVPLAAPGTEADLLHAVERLRSRRLDRSRPLWEMWFLPGLPDARVGLLVRMHHVVADGIASVATMGAFLDAVPSSRPLSAPPPWSPARPPTTRELLLDNLRQRLGGVRRGFSALAHPVAGARRVRAAWPAMRELLTEDRPPVTSLNRVAGPERTLALAGAGLDEVREVAHRHGGTVDDVLLTVTAGGLRALLRGRGEPVDGLVVRVYVPVTLRAAQERSAARGNLIGQMVVPLPIGTADPARRLEQIAAVTATRKARSRPSLGTVFRGRLTGAVLLRALRRNPVNVETADVPGPLEPVTFAGAPLLQVFPLLNLIGNVSLGVGMLSYAGQLGIMAVADRDAYPDLEVFAAGVRAELLSLTSLPRRGRSSDTPGQARRPEIG
ncbi:MAG: wax ester/triacylglycerol synthase family O-acyltransferase [Blastococcus sp.]